MTKIAWLAALAVFLLLFCVYSFRLGVGPELMHDDFEYTYPSFSLAERGNFGSPLLGTGLNIQNRTYNLTVYYYATVHAALIRMFGDGPEAVPLANVLHFALLGAAGTFFLVRRRAYLGPFVFLYALTVDDRMVDAARHGRPEMTAGFCLTMGVLAMWLWHGEGRRRPAVLFGMSRHSPRASSRTPRWPSSLWRCWWCSLFPCYERPGRATCVAGLLPYITIPLLYGYFVLTDSLENVRGQLAIAQGNVMPGIPLRLFLVGDWPALGSLTAEFLHTHTLRPDLWLGLGACLALPAIAPHPHARGARFFAEAYGLCVLVHFLFLKHFVLSYRVVYQPTLYLALAFLAEVLMDRLAGWLRKPGWAAALRIAGVAVLAGLSVVAISQWRSRLVGRPWPYGQLRGHSSIR